MELKYDLSRGEIWMEEKFGWNAAVPTTLETLWDGGTAYAWQTGAEALEILAEQAADQNIVVSVDGLDADYNLQTKIVTTDGSDGTTPVAIDGTFLRVFRARVTSGAPTGNLTIRLVGGAATVRAVITFSEAARPNNQTLMAVFTVPAGYNCRILSYYVTAGKADDATASLFVRPFGEVFQLKHRTNVYQTPHRHVFGNPVQLAAKSDIDLMAKVSLSTQAIHGGFSLELRKL